MNTNDMTANLAADLELLRNVVRPVSSVSSNVELSKVNDIINHRLIDIVKDIAPPDFHMLYTEFKAEYDKYKDFILYDQLIGKHIVALGGGFSSGKSSFLNAVMGKSVLPVDIAPSTSVPTFIVTGHRHYLSGINVFGAFFEIPDVLMIRKISHDFGKNEDEKTGNLSDVIALGHIIETLFFSTYLNKYENLAFLDTPGYSKPDTEGYSVKTDEQIARRQFNAANCILWFVEADAGTITEDDITFIRTLNEETPKLIIVNKADKKADDDIKDIVAKIKSTLELKGVKYIDVLAYSTKFRDQYDADAIAAWLETWNVPNDKSNFAVNFKRIFVKCFDYYDGEIALETKRLKCLNRALTLSGDGDTKDGLSDILRRSKSTLSQLKDVKRQLKELQTEFFAELEIIGDIIGINMPEPSKLELLSGKNSNPFDVLTEYVKKKGHKRNSEYQDIMADAFNDVELMISDMPGGSQYKNSLAKTLELLNDFSKPVYLGKEMWAGTFNENNNIR